MANHRPKSLNELGNLYDKSLEAENEIKKSAMKLEDKPVKAVSAFLPDEELNPAKKTPEQVASDEIADKIGDFAKSFGESEEKKASPIVIPTVQSRPKPPKKKPEKETEKNAAPTSAKLIRNSERTNLFDNYKKVMDDDDDDFSVDEKQPKRRLFKSKNAAPEVEPSQESKNSDDVLLKAEAAVDSVFEKSAKAPEEAPSPFKKVSYQEYKGDSGQKTVQEPEAEPEEKKATGLQVFLMAMLLCVLIASTLIGCVKAFSGLNSEKPLFGKYQLYTVKRVYNEFSIGKSDLIVAKNEAPAVGDIIAYKQGESSYSFAKYESPLNTESVVAVEGGEQIPVFYSDMRGVVTKTIPVLGLLVSVCVSFFLPVMGLMLLLAAILILLIFFSTRPRQEDDEEDEDDDDDDDRTPGRRTSQQEDDDEDNEADAIDDEIESLFSI